MKANGVLAACVLGLIFMVEACKPSSNNNNVTPQPQASFQVSAPASITLPDVYGPSWEESPIDLVMTVTNPHPADTVYYAVIARGKNLNFLEIRDSVAGYSLDTGFGIGNFTRRMQFRHEYANRADTTEQVKVAFWNAQDRDTLTVLVHSNKAKGRIQFDRGISGEGLIEAVNSVSANGFFSPFHYSYSLAGWPDWDKSHSGIIIAGGTYSGLSFYPPLTATPVIFQASTYGSLQSGGISKFHFYLDGGIAFAGADYSTTDTSAGQIKAWMSPQGPVIEVIQPVKLYANSNSINPGALATISAMELYY